MMDSVRNNHKGQTNCDGFICNKNNCLIYTPYTEHNTGSRYYVYEVIDIISDDKNRGLKEWVNAEYIPPEQEDTK